MAKRKIETDRDFERARDDLHTLADAMAERYVASAYDALLEAAARLKPRLPAGYRPAALPTGDLNSAAFACLLVETVPCKSERYLALMGRDPVPFALSDHPDAIAARLLGAYRYGREIEARAATAPTVRS